MTKHFNPPKAINQGALARYLKGDFQLIDLHTWDATSKGKGGAVRPDGKRPIHPNWTKRDYGPSRDVLARCLEEGRNVGFRMTDSQLVLDCDPRNGGAESFLDLCLDSGLRPGDFPKVKTPSGGFHLYMSKPAGLKLSVTREQYPGIEMKSQGGQVVAAGSIHPNGGLYEWDSDHPSIAAGLPPCPPALLAAFERSQTSAAVTSGGQISAEELGTILEELDPTDYGTNADWEPLMMACHHATGGDGRQEFIDWSTSDPAFADDTDRIGRRWDSCDDKKAGARTYKTLNRYLREADKAEFQIRPDGDAVAEDFEGESILTPKEEIFGDDDDNTEWLEQGLKPVKLARVNADNIDRTFSLVNVSGKT